MISFHLIKRASSGNHLPKILQPIEIELFFEENKLLIERLEIAYSDQASWESKILPCIRQLALVTGRLPYRPKGIFSSEGDLFRASLTAATYAIEIMESTVELEKNIMAQHLLQGRLKASAALASLCSFLDAFQNLQIAEVAPQHDDSFFHISEANHIKNVAFEPLAMPYIHWVKEKLSKNSDLKLQLHWNTQTHLLMLRHSENVTFASLKLTCSYVSRIGKKSMTEKKHIDVSVIEAYVEGSISLKQASIMLERTPRTIMRLAAKYRDFGADGLVHGNTGKEPHNKIDSSTREKILGVMQQESLRQMPYSLAIRYLRHEGIEVSAETLRRLLKVDPVLQQERKSNQHPLRRRRAQFGELIQLDGSPHHWFGPQRDRACLMVFIDDATSRITAAQFAPTENSLSYRELIEQHVWRYGIPLAFYSDRHSIFTPVGDHRTLRRNYQLTDYERVCHHLGIETIYAQTPQAKGRIERLNKTLQG